jgi:Zn-dependent metalloprotease
MRQIKFITVALCTLVSFNLYSQQPESFRQIDKDKAGNMMFASLSALRPSNAMTDIALLQELLDFPPAITFRLSGDSILDKSGMIHKVYWQYYKGLKVIGGDYAFHVKDGYLHFINGYFLPIKQDISLIPGISMSDAVQFAERAVLAKSVHTNKQLKLTSQYKEMAILKDPLSDQLRLAFKIFVEASNDIIAENEFIDAMNGKLLLTENLICSFLPPNATGSAQTNYSGTQTIITDVIGSQFRMREVQNGVGINTLNANHSSSYSTIPTTATDIFDNDNNWLANEHGSDRIAYDVHWGAEQSYNYWRNVHGRNSINGAGMNINSYFHVGNNVDNAFWVPSSSSMLFGDGASIFKPLGSVDVCAHEFGHGITQYTVPGGGLGPSGQSPALNEGFSDIWGASVEAWAAPAKQRWLIGEEIMNNGKNSLRNMQNPKDNNSQTHGPDTYQGTNWSNSNSPHTNATVLGHWYYLLSVGGSGTNDNGDNYSIAGVGIDKSSRIAYRTEQLLNPSADYWMTRAMSIQAAIELYGQGSCEEISVTNAWRAVGVGDAYPALSLSITGDWYVCPGSSTTYTLNGVTAGYTITWSVSNTSIASLTPNGNQVLVTSNGDGNVILTATATSNSCNSNAYSSTRVISVGQEAVNVMSNINGLNPPLGVSPGELLELDVASVPNTPVQWAVEGGTIVGSSTNSHVLIQVDQCPPYIYNGYLNVYCTFTHPCGTGTYTEWTTVDCGTGGGGPARISPNPANDRATVELLGPGKTIRELKITDKMGNLIKQIKFPGVNKKETIDISVLPSDIYYVQVFDGKIWTGIHLSVRH